MRQVDPERLARHVVARLVTGIPRGIEPSNSGEEAVLSAIEKEAERRVKCSGRYPLIQGMVIRKEERNADK